MKIAVLCSGSGTNLQAIIDGVRDGSLPVTIAVVVSDNAGSHALRRAADAGIETLVLGRKDFASREEFDKELSAQLGARGVGLVVLAGFMRLLGDGFVKEFRNRILNVHPALLPAFKGTHAIRDALEYGVRVTGATVHFVDEKLDHGPVVLQAAVAVRSGDTEETLLARVHGEEHRILPEAIRLFAEGRLKVEGRKVTIT